jgi:haloacetate dehalogenase
VRGGPIDSGHHMAEEAPDELAAELLAFFASSLAPIV